MNEWEEAGFAVMPRVLPADEIDLLQRALGESQVARSQAGVRHLLSEPAVARLARDPRLASIASQALGHEAIPFRATLFDKSQRANWLVVWHQDTALPLRARREVAGWGPWSIKAGVHYAHAPAEALSRVVALRLHLDDSRGDNGPLRVLPGTHRMGVLTDAQIQDLLHRATPVECLTTAGAVVAMRPLLVHSSSKVVAPFPRRVVHIEYAASEHVGEGLELAIT
jgi:ectoine hydroxylase-related dioxygenase (phytanoyl-CoA dioxygenase family)